MHLAYALHVRPQNLISLSCLYAKPSELVTEIVSQAMFRSRRPSVSWIFAPKTFCLTNQLFVLGAITLVVEAHHLSKTTKSHKVFGKCGLISKHLVAVYKLWYSRLVSLSVQFLIHASSSICICLVWRPDAFLMCAVSASERVLAEPFWKAPRSPESSIRFPLLSHASLPQN